MSTRTFEPIKTTVLGVLSKHLAVPKYQRPYTWKPDNIELLWEDLNQELGDPNFLGVLVLHDNNIKDTDGTRRIEIIDGQQRLTTVTILLALIRNLAEQEGNNGLASTTQMAIEQSNALGSVGYILKASAKLSDFLITNIQSKDSMHDELMTYSYSKLSDEQERIVRNYRAAYKLITESDAWAEDEDRRMSFLTSIKDRLLTAELIEVTVTSEDDAYDLFETLNSRSVSLSEVNMIKNRVFMTLSNSEPEEILESRWAQLETNAGGEKRSPEDIQKFINYFWWSRYQKIPPRQIFRKLRNEDLNYMLAEFEKDSLIYRKFRTQDSSQLINYRHIDLTSIRNLAQILKLQQVYIPLLSLCRKFESDEYWDEFNTKTVGAFIPKLEKFIFAYKFSSRSPAAVERMYSSSAIEIFRSKNRTEFTNALLQFEKEMNENFPSKDEFTESFSKLQYSAGSPSNAIIGYSLSKIYFGDDKEIVISDADLEHIFPRNPSGGFLASEADIETIVNDLGNLTPLSEPINRHECQNKRPADKTRYYYKSNIRHNHTIADYIAKEGWHASDISKRTVEIVDQMWEYLKP